MISGKIIEEKLYVTRRNLERLGHTRESVRRDTVDVYSIKIENMFIEVGRRRRLDLVNEEMSALMLKQR